MGAAFAPEWASLLRGGAPLKGQRELGIFWADVLRSALQPWVILEVLKSGWQTVLGAMAIPLMISGYQTGLIL